MLFNRYLCFYYYNWVNTSAVRLLVQEGIIRPVVNASSLTWFFSFITITGSIPLLVDYISPRRYHPPSSQCFRIDMVYSYIYYWNFQVPNNVIIIKTEVHPLSNDNIAEPIWSILLRPFGFLSPNRIFSYLAFQCFDK